jgi:ribosomal-protein-alanine N-acetyltransferase
MLIIETDRLLLRTLKFSDFSKLIKLWTDPLVTKYMGGPRNKESLEQGFYKDLNSYPLKTDDLWPVVEKSTLKTIGHCGLLEKQIEEKQETELIYVFVQSSWGKGYATEIGLGLRQYALEILELKKLVALIDPQNFASERVAQKIGFEKEKTILRPENKKMVLFKLNLFKNLSIKRGKSSS